MDVKIVQDSSDRDEESSSISQEARSGRPAAVVDGVGKNLQPGMTPAACFQRLIEQPASSSLDRRPFALRREPL
jgi:hypothetical protein